MFQSTIDQIMADEPGWTYYGDVDGNGQDSLIFKAANGTVSMDYVHCSSTFVSVTKGGTDAETEILYTQFETWVDDGVGVAGYLLNDAAEAAPSLTWSVIALA